MDTDVYDVMGRSGPLGRGLTREGAEALAEVSGCEVVSRETEPIPGRPGWRRDTEGREWYSDAWLQTCHS